MLLRIFAYGVVVGLAVPAAFAHAQRRPVALVLVGDPTELPADRRDVWVGHLERAARASGHELVDAERWATERIAQLGDVAPERIHSLSEVESMLSAAQRELAALREPRALAILAEASRIVDAHADVPGSAAWIAEVQTAIGIAAAQAGEPQLMEAAFTRAVLMDPSRGVRAAEAPSHVVERAAAIAREVATRPLGSFEVRADVAGARVLLDDVEVGVAPELVRAPIGTHALRLTAPGHRPWGRVMEILEGRRAPITVALSPDPVVVEARRLEAAADHDDVGGITVALAALSPLSLEAAWVLEVGSGEQDRALLTICRADGCAAGRRIEVDEVPIIIPRAHDVVPEAALAADLSEHRRWLREGGPTVVPPATPEWWERWYVWAGAALVVAAGIAATVVVANELRPEAREQRAVEVMCSPETCPPP